MKQLKVEGTELGENIYVKELSGRQAVEYYERVENSPKGEKGNLTPAGSLDVAALLISFSVTDQDGKSLYDIEAAKDLPFRVMSILANKVLEVSEMTGDAQANPKNG